MWFVSLTPFVPAQHTCSFSEPGDCVVKAQTESGHELRLRWVADTPLPPGTAIPPHIVPSLRARRRWSSTCNQIARKAKNWKPCLKGRR